MPKYCVKKPFTVLVGVVMILVLGFISFTKITTDLLPSISLPYVVAVTSYPGASPEKVEKSVTEVVERSLGKVNRVKNVSSTSAENTSMVMVEFEEDTNMDSAMVKLSTACEQLQEFLPEEAGSPVLMEISPDMMATMTVGIDYDGKDAIELSRFVDEVLLPEFERKDGVAGAMAIGAVTEKAEIRLNESKIDELNDRILAQVDSGFASAKALLDEKEAELKTASADIDKGKSDLAAEEDRTFSEMAEFSQQLDELVATGAAYEAQLNGLKMSEEALQTEKTAYEKDAVPVYNSINSILAARHTNIPELVRDKNKFDRTKTALEQMAQTQPENSELQQTVKNFTWDNIKTLNDSVNRRIPEIDAELANLGTQIAAAQAMADSLNTQIESAKNNYVLVEQGKLSAAAAMGAARAELASGSSQLVTAQTELDKARTEYETSRNNALKNAGLGELLDINSLSKLIYAQNFEMPAGYIGNRGDKVLLKVGDSFKSLDDIREILLCDIDGIGEVRIGDVANVGFTDNGMDSYAKIAGNDAVILNINKASVAGTSEVSEILNSTIEEMEEKYDGLHFTMLMDQGDYIRLIISAILKNLIIGAILAIIVLALFLKDAKPTVVVAFSIPMSVLFAIVLMYFSDITVNLISLTGLAMGVGMLVDNSIVVMENIYRLRNLGIPAAKAAVYGAKQVSGAILASTLTTICVFLPIVFTDGMTRELFTDMGLTMAYSLFASLIVALTFVPAMSSTLLKNTTAREHRLFDRVVEHYENALSFCLNKKSVPVALSVILLAVSVIGAGMMGMELLPEMSAGYIGVSVEMDENLDQEEIYKEADNLGEQILKEKGVETIGAMSGNGLMMDAEEGKKKTEFTFFVQLEDGMFDRDEKIGRNIEKLGENNSNITNVEVQTSNMDMAALGGKGMEIRIEGENLDDIVKTSEDVMKIVSGVEGFEEVTNGQEEADRSVKLVLDKDALMKEGLTVAGVYGTLNDKLKDEASAVNISIEGNDYEVVVVDESRRLTEDNVLDFELETTTKDEKGNDVKVSHKLSEFASLEETPGITAINRDNQSRYITVSAETAEGYNTALLSRDVEAELKDYEAPEGIDIEVVGEIMNIRDMTAEMLKMIALAIAFIYMIMVAQFQSLLSPFIVLFTIPLAFTGGLLALMISGQTISMIALMGFLVLAGVVVNNGIVFVDYVNQLRLAGKEKRDALIEAGKTRIRPILMTALTTILAMSTMVFSREPSTEMTSGMAIVTIGGLAYATLMTLFIVPVLYDVFFRRELKEVDVGELTEDI